jgi:hypothetical protein
MANTRTDNRLVLDTAGAGDIIAASQICHIMGIAWDNAAAVTADAAILTDTAGVRVWSFTITTSLAVGTCGVSFSRPVVSVGLKMPTLTRGVLFVYLYN